MSARNHVEAANARRSRKKRSPIDYTLLVALAGSEVSGSAKTLLRRLRGAMEAGDLTLSGSEDMATAVRDGLSALEKSVVLFDDVSSARDRAAERRADR